jgi:hypothetical protein
MQNRRQANNENGSDAGEKAEDNRVVRIRYNAGALLAMWVFAVEKGSRLAASRAELHAPEVRPWYSRAAQWILRGNAGPNAIKTTKYTVLTWLPKSMWEQFRRIANVYFVFISILMVRVRADRLPSTQT